eukprot:TRINITY_DN573_c0_g1_i1.p1 TRINITY_DN573_c0_g1~~TRINITY_DN573_c0_g1_i1.p1  ORF type:complete len:169 (+),score=46.54 TRINITY_DN573_c0_g1_i1:323-829(+)
MAMWHGKWRLFFPNNCNGLSYPSPASWSQAGNGLVLTYSAGSQTGSGNVRATAITFTCDPSATATSPVFVTETLVGKVLTYSYTWTTAAACPVTGAGGLSGGSIFDIVFFVSLTLYFGIGYTWRYKKFGLRGVEAIPNIDFWRDLPSLLKDGFRFLQSKMSRGYTSVK